MSDHPGRRLAGWVLLALAGLAIAVALSVTASNLSTQPIGLSGEPLRAGDRLAPSNVTRTQTTTSSEKQAKRRKQTTTTETTPVPTTTTGSSAGGDKDADDHGRSRGNDGDDD